MMASTRMVSRIGAPILPFLLVLSLGSLRVDAEDAPAQTGTAKQRAPALRDYRDVIRLHTAGLSDDFVVRLIKDADMDFALDVDRMLELREAGVSEGVIRAMYESGRSVRKGGSAGETPRGAPTAAPTRTSPPTPTPTFTPTSAPSQEPPRPTPTSPPAPTQAPQPARVEPLPERRWDGLVKRVPGVVLFKSRWEPGSLAVQGGELRWVSSESAAPSLVLSLDSLKEQALLCLRKKGESDCFEWTVATASGEALALRDARWAQGENALPLEIQRHFREHLPRLGDGKRIVTAK